MAESKQTITIPVSDDKFQQIAFGEALDALKRKLSARKGMHGYEENVKELEQRIADMEKQQGV